jgi:putative ABC transport system permease protein
MRMNVTLLWEAALIALRSILSHKLRSFLTLLGIILGVASVVVVGASINGLKTYVEESVSKTLGSNSFILARMVMMGNVSREQYEKMNRRNKIIRMDDFEYVRQRCPDCAEVVAEVSGVHSTYYGGEEMYDTQVNGVTANMIYLGNLTLEEGRFFSEHEVRGSRHVAVIGSDVKDKFFPHIDAVNRTIKVGPQPVLVIGVLEKVGSVFGQSLDNVLYMPITAYQKTFGTRRSINIRGRSTSRETFPAALDQVRVAMRTRHHLKPNEEDDFGLLSTDEVNTTVDEFTGAIAAVVIPITAISLVVGGIVVMNIMLVSVTERTFEIGLRKAVGARRRDIVYQFLIESFLLAALGGAIGLGLAFVVSGIVEAASPLPMTITLTYMVLSILFSGGIGIIFGIYPAFKGASLDPIVALTTER